LKNRRIRERSVILEGDEGLLDAAFALRDFAGQYAALLFGVGLFGASFLAGAVLPISTAYGICEAFGFERGVSRSFKIAWIYGVLRAVAVCSMEPQEPKELLLLASNLD
jgi:Mn2+/Fe2+ NRAMP family transporter